LADALLQGEAAAFDTGAGPPTPRPQSSCSCRPVIVVLSYARGCFRYELVAATAPRSARSVNRRSVVTTTGSIPRAVRDDSSIARRSWGERVRDFTLKRSPTDPILESNPTQPQGLPPTGRSPTTAYALSRSVGRRDRSTGLRSATVLMTTNTAGCGSTRVFVRLRTRAAIELGHLHQLTVLKPLMAPRQPFGRPSILPAELIRALCHHRRRRTGSSFLRVRTGCLPRSRPSLMVKAHQRILRRPSTG